MADDAELMRRYSDEGSEPAFRELVQGHAGLVYSAALRLLNGDAHRAQDVTQEVFILLARKAPGLRRHPTLAGWLYTATHFKASEAIRAERRRRIREQESFIMQEKNLNPDALEWDRLKSVLDEAMLDLGAGDREAVLLRYFQARPYAEIAGRYRIGESAAKKRVDRALERLRAAFVRRGVNSSAAALGAVLSAQAATTVPEGVILAAGSAALAAGTGGFWPTLGAWLLPLMSTGNKIALGVLAASLIANLSLVGTLALRKALPPPLVVATADSEILPSGSRTPTTVAGLLGLPAGRWNELAGLSLPDRVVRLRTLGLPQDVIRQYAIQEILEKYAPRYRAIMGGDQPLAPYWTQEASFADQFSTVDMMSKLAGYFRDFTTELRELIGDDAYFAILEDERNQLRLAFGDLPHGKILDLMLANMDFQVEKIRASREPDAQQKLQEIARRENEFRTQLLTPAELERADLATAVDLRRHLAGFNPTEDEFKALFPLKREFDVKYGPLSSGATPAQRERWNAGRQELLDKVAAAIGPERAADYKLASETEGAAGAMTRVVARLGLPFANAEQLRQVQLKAQADAAVARVRGPNETFIVVNQRVSRLLEAFQAQVTPLLGGAGGFDAYRQGAGDWLRPSFGPIGTFATETQKQFFP